MGALAAHEPVGDDGFDRMGIAELGEDRAASWSSRELGLPLHGPAKLLQVVNQNRFCPALRRQDGERHETRRGR